MKPKENDLQPWTDEDSEWLLDEELSGWGWGDEEDRKMAVRTERLKRAVNEINRLRAREKELSEAMIAFTEEVESQIIELINNFLLKKILNEQNLISKSTKQFDKGKLDALLEVERLIDDLKELINKKIKEK